MLSPADLNKELYRLIAEADNADKKLRHWIRKWAAAERDYRVAAADAFLRLAGADMIAAHKEAKVKGQTADLRYERDIYEGMIRAERERVESLRSQISALQTIANHQRAEMDMARTVPDPA